MATTTATLTLSSTDLLSDELALSTTATLTSAGNSTGLTGTTGLARKTLASGHSQYTLFDGSDYTADKAHKLYLKNTSTTASEYFLITVNSEDIGRIYAGDWALIPWSAHDADNDIKIDPSADDMTLEYMLFTDE
jgi:hypothetical protein|tara:strand:+ start:137 stop:541 length:405 start_codon:yes stop_codon:yes gene_type:complete